MKKFFEEFQHKIDHTEKLQSAQKSSQQLRKSSQARYVDVKQKDQEKGKKSNTKSSQYQQPNQQIQQQPFYSEKPIVKFKVKTRSKQPQASHQHLIKTEETVSQNDLQVLEHTMPNKQILSGQNLEDVLKVEEYSSQTPLNQKQDFNTFHEDIKFPMFAISGAGRDSFLGNSGKGQFYMTQVIGAANKEDPNNIYQSQNIKNMKSRQNHSKSNKKVTKNQSSLAKSYQKMSPMLSNKNTSGTRYNMPLGHQGQQLGPGASPGIHNPSTMPQATSKNIADKTLKKRAQLNQSAQFNNQSKDNLHATAPIQNLGQFQNLVKQTSGTYSGITNNPSDINLNMKSTQMLKHIGSKESWKDASGIYTNFIQEIPGSQPLKTSVIQSAKSSMSPNKYQKSGQVHSSFLIEGLQRQQVQKQSHESQDPNGQKYFLNLTLQKLIQEQKQTNIASKQPAFMDQKLHIYTDQVQLQKENKQAKQGDSSNQYSLGISRRLNKTQDGCQVGSVGLSASKNHIMNTTSNANQINFNTQTSSSSYNQQKQNLYNMKVMSNYDPNSILHNQQQNINNNYQENYNFQNEKQKFNNTMIVSSEFNQIQIMGSNGGGVQGQDQYNYSSQKNKLQQSNNFNRGSSMGTTSSSQKRQHSKTNIKNTTQVFPSSSGCIHGASNKQQSEENQIRKSSQLSNYGLSNVAANNYSNKRLGNKQTQQSFTAEQQKKMNTTQQHHRRQSSYENKQALSGDQHQNNIQPEKDLISKILNLYKQGGTANVMNDQNNIASILKNPINAQSQLPPTNNRSSNKHKGNTSLAQFLQQEEKRIIEHQNQLIVSKEHNNQGSVEVKNYSPYQKNSNNSKDNVNYYSGTVKESDKLLHTKQKVGIIYKNQNTTANTIKQQQRKSSGGLTMFGNTLNQGGMIQHDIKELQNRTQPLPKSILEMARAELAMESSGNSQGGRRTSIGSVKNNNSYGGRATKTRGVKNNSNINITTAQAKKEDLNLDNEIQPQQEKNKPKVGNKKDLEIVYNSNFSPKNVDPPKKLGDRIQNELNKKEESDIKEVKADKYEVLVKKNPQYESILDSECLNEDSEHQRLDRFVLGRQIGQGAYAVVRLALNKEDNKKYAIKVYDKSKLTDTNRQKSVRREIKLLQRMNHPNIVKIYEAFETESHVYLVMENIDGGSLHSYLKSKPNRRLEEEDAKRIFQQILTALQYCHRKSIAHRDIKLENILLDDDKNVKLIDFGFSTCIPNDKKIKMFCGTPSYMAPEIVMKIEYAGPPADVWASAVLLYALMNGCFPYRGATDKELYRRIQRGTFVMHNYEVSDELLNILTRMLNIDADDRPSVDDILDYEWFSKITQKLNHEDDIAQQKKLFKAKILAKLPFDKNKSNIQISNTNNKIQQEQQDNHQTTDEQTNQTKENTVSSTGGQTNQQQINNFKPQSQTHVQDFSDYGLSQNTQSRRLNQEAYQAYYNTNGSHNGTQQSQIPNNPYFNNFFQGSLMNSGNNALGGLAGTPVGPQQPINQTQFQQQQQQQQYPGIQTNNFQMRLSPTRFNQHWMPINMPGQNPQNSLGTPQVLCSPTGFQCTAGMINNNFNIINNITQVISSPTQQSIDQQQQQQQQQQHNLAQNPSNEQKEQQKVMCHGNDDCYDEQIISSITKLGYQKSHVISQLENETSNISNLYAKMKDDKMSKTQNRPLSLQPHGMITNNNLNHPGNFEKVGGQNNNTSEMHPSNYYHNAVVFPNFVPSFPDSQNNLNDQSNNSFLMKTGKINIKKINININKDITNNNQHLLKMKGIGEDSVSMNLSPSARQVISSFTSQ